MKKLNELLIREAKTVGIAGHIRPDGDCVGSVLALFHYIRSVRPQIAAEIYLEELPQRFARLPGADRIRTDYPEEKSFDLFFALDCGDRDRLGPAKDYFEKAGRTVCIDHHISNTGYGDDNVVEPQVSSTCEVLYTLMDPQQIGKETALCLYLGMAHDTGVFQYSNTTSRTLAIAGNLLEYGFDHTGLINETFYEKTYLQTKMLGRALTDCRLELDGRMAVSGIQKKTMDQYGAGSQDMEGIVSQLKLVKGVETAAFLYELKAGEFKVSLRSSRYVDVNAIASSFGGGGHARAAGCSIKGTYDQAVEALVREVERQMKSEAVSDCITES